MGRKVWLWIFAGLAILVALAVTAVICFGALRGGSQETPTEGTASAPEETVGSEQEQSQATQEQATQEQATQEQATQEQTPANTDVEDTTGEAQQEQTTQNETDTTFPPPANENQLPMG